MRRAEIGRDALFFPPEMAKEEMRPASFRLIPEASFCIARGERVD